VSNIKKFQAAGMVARRHRLSKAHQRLLERLTAAEVRTLIRVKKKLGTRFVTRTAAKSAKVRAETFIL
jgi:hypothetical protein